MATVNWKRAWAEMIDATVLVAEQMPKGDWSDEAAAKSILRSIGPDDKQVFNQLFACMRWASVGCPHLILGPKRAAYYASTQVKPDVKLLPPWPALYLSLRDSVIGDGDSRIVGALVLCQPAGPWLFQLQDNRGSTFGFALKLEHFGRLDEYWNNDDNVVPNTIDSVATRRVTLLMSQLMAGVCLEFQAFPDVTQEALRHGSGDAGRKGVTKSGKGDLQRYVFTEDIVVDARPVVTEFMLHGGKSPTVRSFTRPHARRQHYGPGNSEVKIIRVEGFWRGPKDGPVAVRAHRFAKDENPNDQESS